MSGYGYSDYGYAAYGYGGYGYYGAGAYAIYPGGLNAPNIYLSGPGSGGYYVSYSGTAKYVNSAYENEYGGQTRYAATLKPSGNYTRTSYFYQSGHVIVSSIDSYISHAEPVTGFGFGYGYGYGYNYHPIAIDYDTVSGTTYLNGATEYVFDRGSSTVSYFDGSYKTSYTLTTMTEYNDHIVAGSTHTYSAESYTDPSGYTTYHISQT